jgi:acetyl-CoA acetyltransferase family protein
LSSWAKVERANTGIVHSMSMTSQDAFIVDAARSPFARGIKGLLVATRLDEVAGTVIARLIDRVGDVDPREIEELLLGNVRGGDELAGMPSAAISRVAGLPVEVATATVNRQCGSSMQALHTAARAIMTGGGDSIIAAGVERMSLANAPRPPPDTPLTRVHERVRALDPQQKQPDPSHHRYFSVAFPEYLLDSPADPTMIQTGQNVAEVWNLSRQELDAFALASHSNADAAYRAGRYATQIIPVQITPPVFDAAGKLTYSETGVRTSFDRDECIRLSSPEKMASLGTLANIVSYGGREIVITAGNCCPINDGASVALLVSGCRAKALRQKPLARIVSMAVSGVKPQLMGVGTIPASIKALDRAGLRSKDIGLAEINEAFASQALVTARELELDPSLVNVNGGAIAIGHPLGASGIRLLVSLCHEMRRRGNVRYGLATMCIGAGMGIATVVEAVS